MTVTAKKIGRYGVQYCGHGTIFTFWPMGQMFASVREMGDGRRIPSIHPTRLDAVLCAGEWIDPEQDGRHIIDNDLGGYLYTGLENERM